MTPILELAAALHARYLGMLEAYLDESFNQGPNPRVYVVAGWFGEASAWRDLEEQWRMALATEPSVREFKSADCLARQKQFLDWCPDRSDRFRAVFADVIRESRILGVTVAMTLNESPELARKAMRKRIDYGFCAKYCMAQMVLLADAFPVGERIAFIVDERSKGVGDLQEIRRELRFDSPPQAGKRVGPIGYDSSADVLPLQAADFLAHEVFMQRVNEINHRPSRETFTKFLTPRMVSRDTFHYDQFTQEFTDYSLLGRNDRVQVSSENAI
jgi:hypothetical protein